MSFEIYQTLQSPENRLEQGGVLLAREILDYEGIHLSAQQMIDNRASIQEISMENELIDNAQTGIFEQLRAAGHLSHLEFTGDQYEIHTATIQRLLNGYKEDGPKWEKDRNFQELCEEIIIFRVFCLIKQGDLPEDTMILLSSDIPDDKFVDDSERRDAGYRTLNKKGMIRSHSFSKNKDGSWTRVLEQVSRANSDDLSTRRWHNEHSAAVPISATGGLSELVITSTKRMPNGVVTFMQELDGIFGTDRLYGESGSEMIANNRPSYENLRSESAKKEIMLSKFTDMLYEKDAELKKKQLSGEISYQERLYFFDQEIKTKITPRILINYPEFTTDAYGKVSAPIVEQAHVAFRSGDYHATERLMVQAMQKKETGSDISCGGSGSRKGNEPQDLDGIAADAVEGAKADVEDSGNKEMNCPFCQEKTIGDPCAKAIVCTNCSADSSCSESENNKRAAEYKRLKMKEIEKKDRMRKLLIAKSSKEQKVGKISNDQFAIA